MYYESIRILLEKEFNQKSFKEEYKFKGLDLLNKLSESFDKLSNSKPIIYVAAITFFILDSFDETRTFKELGENFDIEPKTLALKVKEIAPFLGIDRPEDIIKKGLLISAIEKVQYPKEITGDIIKINSVNDSEVVSSNSSKKTKNTDIFKNTKKISPARIELKDKELINLFKKFKSFTELLFIDKDYIEIKQFIKLMELNLYTAGYDKKDLNLEKRFGDLFVYLGFEPKKGRESEKFVSLKDRFGQSEPYTLIKLGE